MSNPRIEEELKRVYTYSNRRNEINKIVHTIEENVLNCIIGIVFTECGNYEESKINGTAIKEKKIINDEHLVEILKRIVSDIIDIMTTDEKLQLDCIIKGSILKHSAMEDLLIKVLLSIKEYY